MATWDSDQYLKFASERTQPAIDLARRIVLENPARIIDLGCGPGNSTAVLAARWPAADLTGLDSSPAMISAARREFPGRNWREGDIGTWSADTAWDLVFSNAALQWVPDHARLFPHLLAQVAAGGALAVQVPANLDFPAHQVMREIGASARWRDFFQSPVRDWHVEEPAFYYDTLAPHAARLEMWLTDYLHIMPGPESLVEWYRGSGLRPWLDALPGDAERAGFLADYLREITAAYPRRPDGRVLFPFRRLFLVAYR